MARMFLVMGVILAVAVPAAAAEDARKKFFAGAGLYEAGDFEGALDWLDQSLALDPDFCRAHYYRARCLIEIGEDKSAAKGAAGDFERCASGGEAEDIAELWDQVDGMAGGSGGSSRGSGRDDDDDDDRSSRSSRYDDDDEDDDDDRSSRSSRDEDDDFYTSERWTGDDDDDDSGSRSSSRSDDKGSKGTKGKKSDRSSRSSRDDDDEDDDRSSRSSRYEDDDEDDDRSSRSSRDDDDSWQDDSDRWEEDEEPVAEDDWRDDEEDSRSSSYGGSKRSSGSASASLKKRRTVGAVMTFSGIAAGVAGFALTGYFYHYYFNLRNESDEMSAWFMGTQSGGITLGAVGTTVGLAGLIVWAAPAKGASVSVAPGPITTVAIRF